MAKLEFYKAPEIQTGYIFNPKKSFFSIIVPEEATNLIYNPEANHAQDFVMQGFPSVINFSHDYKLFGDRSISAHIYPGTKLIHEMSTTLEPDTVYTFSAYMLLPSINPDAFVSGGGEFRISISNFNYTKMFASSEVFTLTSDIWERKIITFRTPVEPILEPVVIEFRNSGLGVQKIYVDGLQMERNPYATTFISGNLTDSLMGENPRPYYWLGPPHKSPSVRSGATRDGGKVVSLEELGFHVTSFNGLGVPQFDVVSSPIANGFGSIYQGSAVESREFEICGILATTTVRDFFLNRGQLGNLVNPSLTGRPQPIKLLFSIYEGDKQICNQVEILAVYNGGLEGEIESIIGEEICISFTMLDPLVKKLGNNSSPLNTFKTVENEIAPIGTNAYGEYFSMSEGFENVFGTKSIHATFDYSHVSVLKIGTDNNLYMGTKGAFDGNAFGRWNGKNWEVLGRLLNLNGTADLNGIVTCIEIGPDNKLYIGGAFDAIQDSDGIVTNYTIDPSGNATNTKMNIVRYNINTNKFEYIGKFVNGTKTNSSVQDIKLLRDGRLLIVGRFNTPKSLPAGNWTWAENFIAYDPYYNMFVPLVGGSGARMDLGQGSTDIINTCAEAPNGEIWVGGQFTDVGSAFDAYAGGPVVIENIAVLGKYDTRKFEPPAGGKPWLNLLGGAVKTIVIGPDNAVYAGGEFRLTEGFSTIYPDYTTDQIPAQLSTNIQTQFSIIKLVPNSNPGWISLGILGYTNVEATPAQRYGIVNEMKFDKSGKLHVVGLFNYASTIWENKDYIATSPANGFFHTVLEALVMQQQNVNGYAIWDGTQWIIPDILLHSNPTRKTRNITAIEVGGISGANYNADIGSIPSYIYQISGTGTTTVGTGFTNSLFLGTDTPYDFTSKDIKFIDLKNNVHSKPIFVITGPGRLLSIKNEMTGAVIYFDYTLSAAEVITVDLTKPLFNITSNLNGNMRGIVRPNSNLASFVLNSGIVGISVNMDLLSITPNAQPAIMRWRTNYWAVDQACEYKGQ